MLIDMNVSRQLLSHETVFYLAHLMTEVSVWEMRTATSTRSFPSAEGCQPPNICRTACRFTAHAGTVAGLQGLVPTVQSQGGARELSLGADSLTESGGMKDVHRAMSPSASAELSPANPAAPASTIAGRRADGVDGERFIEMSASSRRRARDSSHKGASCLRKTRIGAQARRPRGRAGGSIWRSGHGRRSKTRRPHSPR
jgi:hypothetical protein